jgi:hypothetical protein
MNERDDDKRVGGKPTAPPQGMGTTGPGAAAPSTPATSAPAASGPGASGPAASGPTAPDASAPGPNAPASPIPGASPTPAPAPAARVPGTSPVDAKATPSTTNPAAATIVGGMPKPTVEGPAKPAAPSSSKPAMEPSAKPVAPDVLAKPAPGAASGPTLAGADPVSKPIAKETLPPPSRQAGSGRGLAWAALVVGAIGLGAGLLAIAGPRVVLLAERQFPGASWTEGLRASLNPGWSVAPAEFDRRVNLLEGVLAKADPAAVSRQDVVDLLLGRFEAKRSDEMRATIDAARNEATAAAQRLTAAEAALSARVEPVERATAALDAALTAAKTSIEEVRTRVEALSVLEARAEQMETRAEGIETRSGQIESRVGQAETQAAAIATAASAAAKRLDEVALAVEAMSKRASGAERLLVATMQLQISAQSGRAFANELRLARQLAAQDEVSNRLLDRLVIPAQRGVATPADLRSQFQDVAAILVDQGVAAERSWAQRMGSNVRGALAGVGLSAPPDPTRVEAAVTEAGRYLAAGNLPAALAELNTLEPPLQALGAGWITQARLRLSVDQTVAEIAQHVVDLMARGS